MSLAIQLHMPRVYVSLQPQGLFKPSQTSIRDRKIVLRDEHVVFAVTEAPQRLCRPRMPGAALPAATEKEARIRVSTFPRRRLPGEDHHY